MSDMTGTDIVVASEILLDKLHILPVEPRPVFPNTITPLTFTGQAMIDVIKDAYENQNKMFGAVLVYEREDSDYFQSKLYEVGTVVKIFKMNQPDEDSIQVLAQGLQRFSKVRDIENQREWADWEVRYHYDAETEHNEELKAYAMAIMSNIKELLRVNPLLQESVKMMLSQLTYDNITVMLDLVSAILSSESYKLQDLLETFDLVQRSEKLLVLLKEELELLSLQEKIQNQIQDKVNHQQKEFFLKEQLKAIKKELGMEKDDKTTEVEKIENRLKDLSLTEEAQKTVDEELNKLRIMETHSSEYHVTRNYLDTLTSLPWGKFSKDNMNIKKARRTLNMHHYGLDDVKKTILQFMSTVKKRGKLTGSIICLVGPPGVGKTSIGRSIAEALNREFFRFSVGGMRDEAEIKGHRRTYIGAMPGKIIQALKRTGNSNPVIMLDEIDKMSKSFQGDPASALLEVLDPEQNVNFLDHYLDVRFDLSKVLFIATANSLDSIPAPLLDRMEVIRLSGYILEEKLQIAKKYLIPRQLEEHGISPQELKITEGALEYVIDRYAREAGVRNLEKQLKKLMREFNLEQIESHLDKLKITVRQVEKLLGKPKFTPEELYPESIPGVTMGLAWTAMGGAILYIEANSIPHKTPKYKQTGQLGDVMKESAEIAYSFIRSFLSKDKEHKTYFDKHQVHIHVPEGATPKDGPSAGVTMALALYSLALNKPLPRRLGMTGELTLTGKVLPIGGLREKTIAARRVNVKELIFPKANKRDYDELPEYIKKGIKAHFVSYFTEVLDIAYGE